MTGGWVVVCGDYTAGPFRTAAAALARAAASDRLAACTLPHRIAPAAGHQPGRVPE